MTQTNLEKIAQARAYHRLAVDGQARVLQRLTDARIAALDAQDRVAAMTEKLAARDRDLEDAERRLWAALADVDGAPTAAARDAER